jgi:CDP-diacylglycerol--serine O-phosphatidyltransferase
MLVGCLLISRLPTFASKHIQIKKEYVRIVMIVFGIAILEALLHPWYALPIICVCYFISMFFSFMQARKIEE